MEDIENAGKFEIPSNSMLFLIFSLWISLSVIQKRMKEWEFNILIEIFQNMYSLFRFSTLYR